MSVMSGSFLFRPPLYEAERGEGGAAGLEQPAEEQDGGQRARQVVEGEAEADAPRVTMLGLAQPDPRPQFGSE